MQPNSHYTKNSKVIFPIPVTTETQWNYFLQTQQHWKHPPPPSQNCTWQRGCTLWSNMLPCFIQSSTTSHIPDVCTKSTSSIGLQLKKYSLNTKDMPRRPYPWNTCSSIFFHKQRYSFCTLKVSLIFLWRKDALLIVIYVITLSVCSSFHVHIH